VISVEHERASVPASLQASVQHVTQDLRYRENTADLRLRSIWAQANHAAIPIDLVPCGIQNLVLPPARVIGEIENVLIRTGQMLSNANVLVMLEKALTRRVLAKTSWECGNR
jgi:hypothetical protein